MPNIQVSASRRRDIEEAHRAWARSLPHQPGQLGAPMSILVAGPPLVALTMSGYGQFDNVDSLSDVRFMDVAQEFVDYLKHHGIPFEEN